MEDPAIPSVAKVQGEVHDGPARANQTDSSAGALEAPAKTNTVTSSVEDQAVPAKLSVREDSAEAQEESKVDSSDEGMHTYTAGDTSVQLYIWITCGILSQL